MTSPFSNTPTPKGTLKYRPTMLREALAGILASDPGKQWTIREITAKLGRTSGAVPQALDKLVGLGRATRHPGRRYQHASGTATLPAPAPAARPAPAPNPRQPVRRPNGELYYPRLLGGKPDVQTLRQLRTDGIPVLLYGPPGTGKTSLIEAAFGDELHTVAGDGDTTVGDLLGDYVPDGGGYRFADGPQVKAMETGGVLFIDDATLISPKVLAAMYPAMDGRREIVIKANGGRQVKAAPGFFVVAGHNPNVHGAILTEALASRFTTHIEVTSDFDLAAKLGVDPKILRAARLLNAKASNAEIGWAPQLREVLGFHKLAAALGFNLAVANLIGIAPGEDRDVVIETLKTCLPGVPLSPLTLGNQI